MTDESSHRRLSLYAVAALCVVASGQAASQAPIDEVVTVETRLDVDRFDFGESVSVSSADLESIRPVDAENLFRLVSGFSVSRPGGPGGISEVFLRGAESNFTAVYVDGVRLNDPPNTRGGSFDFSSLAACSTSSESMSRRAPCRLSTARTRWQVLSSSARRGLSPDHLACSSKQAASTTGVSVRRRRSTSVTIPSGVFASRPSTAATRSMDRLCAWTHSAHD